jgi:phage gpG-like protein
VSSFTGDFGKLGLLQVSVAKLAAVPSQIAPDVARGIEGEIREEFQAGTDPYHRPWAQLRPATLAKGRRPPPLTDTREMIGSLDVRPSQGAGVTVEFGAEYAGFHQVGTKDMVARPPLPTGGFPSTWSQIIRDAAAKKFSEATR